MICLLFSTSLSDQLSFFSLSLFSTVNLSLHHGFALVDVQPCFWVITPAQHAFSFFFPNTTHLRIYFSSFTFVIKLSLSAVTSRNLFLPKLLIRIYILNYLQLNVILHIFFVYVLWVGPVFLVISFLWSGIVPSCVL